MDMKILDSLIALVVVILTLSLIVQSIQAVAKKLFKIKSRAIEVSLVDLFESALDLPGKRGKNLWDRCTENSPLVRLFLFRKPPVERAGREVRELVDAVRTEFQDIGRVALSGRWMLDSLAKEDLSKILAHVAPGTLLPDFAQKFEDACRQVDVLEKALKIDASTLSGKASARFAALREALVPLINDVRAIYDGQQVRPGLLVRDAVRLREVRLDDVLKLLAEIQQGIDRDLEKARGAGQDVAVLADASTRFKQVAESLAEMHFRFDAALAPLRTRLQSVETWFDTVMQSFQERYSRDMKTWAVVISFLVVVVMNADFFSVAGEIWRRDDKRIELVQLGEELRDQRARLVLAEQNDNALQAQTLERQVADIKKEIGRTEEYLDTYAGFGFRPLSEVDSPGQVFKRLPGWLVMTLLLSVGAPFWQDMLESLFGIKNLLRKRGDIKHVEQASGTGYPRQA